MTNLAVKIRREKKAKRIAYYKRRQEDKWRLEKKMSPSPVTIYRPDEEGELEQISHLKSIINQ